MSVRTGTAVRHPWSRADNKPKDPAPGHPRTRRRRRLRVDHRTAWPEPRRADRFPPEPPSAPTFSRSPSTTPRSLPPAIRREAMHRWPVKSPDAYPVVARRGPGGIPRPLVERDVETVAAWTLALSAFLPRHAAIFKADTFIPLCESYFDDTDREVRFMLTLIGEVRFMLTLIGQLFSGRAG